MSMQGPRTAEWFERARANLVNGVSSGFRYLGDDDTLVIDRGPGRIRLGHGRQAIHRPAVCVGSDHPWATPIPSSPKRWSPRPGEGTTFAMTQRREVEAAEAVLKAIKWADRIRFTNTGTEATMHAIRLARGWGGRDLIVKFEGHYHGTHDYVLFTTAGAPPAHLGSRLRPIPYQVSSGIPDAIRSFVRTLPFNDVEALEDLFDDHGHEIAAVIVEPACGNAFGILPEPGFLDCDPTPLQRVRGGHDPRRSQDRVPVRAGRGSRDVRCDPRHRHLCQVTGQRLSGGGDCPGGRHGGGLATGRHRPGRHLLRQRHRHRRRHRHARPTHQHRRLRPHREGRHGP